MILELELAAVLTSVPLITAQSPRALFNVHLDGKGGYINELGDIVIRPQFDGASPFYEGLARVVFHSPTYSLGYIDESGRLVIPPEFDRAMHFSEGLAEVGFGEFTLHGGGDHRWGFIDTSGSMVIKPKYREVRRFKEGLAAVLDDDGRWGYIDRAGQLAIPFQYDSAGEFSEGLARVERERLYGFVNKRGEVTIPIRFTSARGFSEGLAGVRIGGDKVGSGYEPTKIGGRWVYIDKAGETVLPLGSDVMGVDDFSGGRAAVDIYRSGRILSGYIDHQGATVIEPQFTNAAPFSEDLALVSFEVNGPPHFIDKGGKVVLSPDALRARSFRNGLAQIERVSPDGTHAFGYIDRTGRVVWPPTR